MIYRHQNLPQNYTKDKKVVPITKQSPLLLIKSTKSLYLNNFVESVLKLKNVQFQTKQTQQTQVMGYQLPALAFKDYMLSGQTMVEFLSDIFLSEQQIQKFVERKNIVRLLYKKWAPVIRQASEGLVNYSSLKQIGIFNEKDLHNHLFSEFLLISSYANGQVLFQQYEMYKPTEINLQKMMCHDIVNSILKMCGHTLVDYILRSNFQRLIIFQKKFSQILAIKIRQNPQDMTEKCVIFDKISQQDSKDGYQKLNFNVKRFTIAFSIIALLYANYVQ